MKSLFSGAMHKAAQLTRNQNVIEATRVIRRALSGRLSPQERSPENSQSIELSSGEVARSARSASVTGTNGRDRGAERRPPVRVKKPLGEVLELLRQANLPSFVPQSNPLVKARGAPPVVVPDGANFLTRTFACEAGPRDYKVYLPSRMNRSKRPLIVMLHGCSQNPDDFAVGTGMNLLAEEHGFIVAYPRQATSSNPSACWKLVQSQGPNPRRGGTEHHRRDYAQHHGGIQY
jgi:hypothetical protein